MLHVCICICLYEYYHCSACVFGFTILVGTRSPHKDSKTRKTALGVRARTHHTKCGSSVHLPIIQRTVFSLDSTCKIGAHSVSQVMFRGANAIVCLSP